MNTNGILIDIIVNGYQSNKSVITYKMYLQILLEIFHLMDTN